MEFEQLSMFQETGFKMKKVKPMKILVACEESQAVCIELRKLGHEAYSADIQPCSGNHPEWHILGDVIPLINGDCKFTTMDGVQHDIVGEWDMLIAHPPCDFLSNAGACRLYPTKGHIDMDRYQKGIEGKAFFMKFINAKCKKIVVENPVPSKVFDLPKATQYIQPHNQYGKHHPYTKKTGLWIVGDLPKIVPVEPVQPIGPYCPSGTSRKDRNKYGAAKRGNDKKNRSKTFYGVARSIAEQLAGDARDYVEDK